MVPLVDSIVVTAIQFAALAAELEFGSIQPCLLQDVDDEIATVEILQ